MRRVERRLFRINDRLRKLAEEAEDISAELDYHRLIDDDAQRDAAVGNYIDREEAGLTAADVRRFEKALEANRAKRAELEAKRERLLSKLG